MARGKARSEKYDHFGQYRPFEFRSLSNDQLNLLHDASLEIMARTGMRFYEPEALDLFKKAGASVTDGNLVRIPPHLVEEIRRAQNRADIAQLFIDTELHDIHTLFRHDALHLPARVLRVPIVRIDAICRVIPAYHRCQ
mgnify:CR=1 FL=1